MSPELRVIRGEATPEELAAVVAVLARSGARAVEEQPGHPSLWARPQLRAPLPAPAPGAWVACGLRI
jgi:hypothetical protein